MRSSRRHWVPVSKFRFYLKVKEPSEIFKQRRRIVWCFHKITLGTILSSTEVENKGGRCGRAWLWEQSKTDVSWASDGEELEVTGCENWWS